MTQAEIGLRPATEADLAHINTIIASAIAQWALPERVKRLTLPSLQYTATDLGFQTLRVALNGQEPMGIVAWEEAGPADRLQQAPTLLLHGIYVDPKAQGQGIGRVLFQQAENAAREQGLAGIVVKAQKGSEAFYQAMGLSPMPVTDASRDFENRFAKTLVTTS
ncbi:MAG: GNAT family N-acetyltransferase [Saccharospirillum sp.]